MQNRLYIRTAIFSTLFALVVMGIMIYYVSIREILPHSTGEVLAAEETVKEVKVNIMDQLFSDSGENTDFLCIPLPAGVGKEQVIITDDYVNQSLSISYEGIDEQFFVQNKLSGNRESIKEAYYINTRNEEPCGELKLALTGVYEYQEEYQDGNLYIDFVPPKELYDRIVVIDAGHGGDSTGVHTPDLDEKELTLDITTRLKILLDQSDIHAYYTRLEDEDVADENRVNLANQTKADMYISIHAGDDEKTKKRYGIQSLYNQTFFIPSFSSVDLANILEEEVGSSVNGKTLGLVAGDESTYIIRNATVPVVQVEVGYMTNQQELILLEKEEYQDKIAQGIYNGILRAYDEMDGK